MKGLDITADNLEDLLAYDDPFMDYFNAFLALPAFPQPLQYDRLADSFREVPGSTYSLSGSAHTAGRHETPVYGATDEEREKQLQWAKDERLPLFLRTQLFREFKLSKLLLRPLDDRYSASRGSSRNLRGYSRQTDSYLSSLSNSAGNNEANEFSWSAYRNELYRYKRPGSRALSLPTMQGEFVSAYEGSTQYTSTTGQSYSNGSIPYGLSEAKKTNLIKWHNSQLEMGDYQYSSENGEKSGKDKDVTFSHYETLMSINEDSSFTSNTTSDGSSPNKLTRFKRLKPSEKYDEDEFRAFSAPVNYEDFQKQPAHKDFDFMFGEDELDNAEQYVAFGEDNAANEEQTEEDMKNLEGKHQMTYQQMKEEALGNASGLKEFLSFLSDTAGKKMADYWMDCEFYKDTMEDLDEVQNVATRSRLFRDIKGKYRLSFTNDGQEQMQRASSNASLSHTVFLRTQYDVLRRLRAYWVPRFIIHKGRVDGFGFHEDKEKEKSRPESHLSGFFPSISLVNSLPVKPDDILQVVKTMNWDFVRKAGREYDSRVKSAKRKSSNTCTEYETQVLIPTRTIKEILVLALTCDKAAGGPFKSYLEKKNSSDLLSNLLFWEDVTEYGMAEDRSADRLLRMCHAWDIYNQYIAEDSLFNIGVNEKDRIHVYKTLISTKDFVSASLFDVAKSHAVDLLQQAWIRYLKEDLKTFLECSASHLDSRSPPGTAEDIEVFVQNGRIIVRRPIRKLPSNREGLASAESIDSVEREHRRKKALEKRRIMEIERRKALKAAKQRLREMKLAKNKPETIPEAGQEEEGHGDEEGEYFGDVDGAGHEDGEGGGGSRPKKPVNFVNLSKNKGLMAVFKKILAEQQDHGKDLVNMINLYHELNTYSSITGLKTKKELQATTIYKNKIRKKRLPKTYLDPKSKKSITMTEKINARLGVEKDRPRSPTLREIGSYIVPLIEEAFKDFWTNHVEQMGLTAEDIANLSASELAMKLGDSDLKAGGGKNRRMRKRLGVSFRGDPDLRGIDFDELLEQMTSTNDGSGIFQDSFPSLSASSTLLSVSSSAFGRKDSKLQLTKSDSKLTDSAHDVESVRTKSTEPAKSDPRKKKKKKKAGGRAQPTKEDKIDFLLSLNQSAMGKLPIHMIFFYGYLQRWGEEDGFPMLDKDLIFYIEVQKFKDCSHAHSNEELLRKKVQAISDTFLESAYPPPLQIDVPQDLHQKMVKTAQRYSTGKEITPNLFDEAQYLAFKELLPYWAGFKKQYVPPEDPGTRPLTKRQKLLKKRLELFESMPMPKKNFKLPKLPDGPVGSMTFSLTEGVKWKLEELTDRSGEDFPASRQVIRGDLQSRMQSSRQESSLTNNSITGTLA